MRRFWIPTVVCGAGIAVLSVTAGTQTPPIGTLLNRMNSAYRSLQSYRDNASLRRKIGDKELTGSVTIATQKANKYLLELKGDYINTIVNSDGTALYVQRPDRKVYTKSKAPLQLIHADMLAGVDI